MFSFSPWNSRFSTPPPMSPYTTGVPALAIILESKASILEKLSMEISASKESLVLSFVLIVQIPRLGLFSFFKLKAMKSQEFLIKISPNPAFQLDASDMWDLTKIKDHHRSDGEYF